MSNSDSTGLSIASNHQKSDCGSDLTATSIVLGGQQQSSGSTQILNPFFQENLVAELANQNTNQNGSGVFGQPRYSENKEYSRCEESIPTNSVFTRIANFITTPTVISPAIAGVLSKVCLATPFITTPAPDLGGIAIVLGASGLYGSLWVMYDAQKKHPLTSAMPLTTKVSDVLIMGSAGFVWGAAFGVLGMCVSPFLLGGVATTAQSAQTSVVGAFQDKQLVPQRQTTSHHKALLSIAPC